LFHPQPLQLEPRPGNAATVGARLLLADPPLVAALEDLCPSLETVRHEAADGKDDVRICDSRNFLELATDPAVVGHSTQNLRDGGELDLGSLALGHELDELPDVRGDADR
jgi:hypothetical protein